MLLWFLFFTCTFTLFLFFYYFYISIGVEFNVVEWGYDQKSIWFQNDTTYVHILYLYFR